MNIIASIIIIWVAYNLIKYIYHNKWDKGLTVQLAFNQNEAFEGDYITMTETVTNRKFIPLPILMIKFNMSKCLRYLNSNDEINSDTSSSITTDQVYRNDIVSISSYQKKIRTIHIRCVHRGYCHLNSLYIVCSDFFLNEKMTKNMDCNTQIYIYPRFVDSKKFDFSFKSLMGDIVIRRYINEDPFAFKGIRDYQSFDSMKSINWKAFAKSLGLKVNQTDATSSWQVTILLNLDTVIGLRDHDLDEESIRLSATFVNRFIHQGIPVSFVTNAYDSITNESICIGHGCGNEHEKTILMALSRLDITKHEPDDFTSLLDSTLNNTQSNSYVFVISQITNTSMANVLNNSHNIKLILPTRFGEHPNIEPELVQFAIPWEVNF